MNPPADGATEGARLFLATKPLEHSQRLARELGCDLAIPNDSGIGNILMYTRVVDDLAFTLGRPLHLLTARLTPAAGTVPEEEPFPIWRNNPCVRNIVDADAVDPTIMPLVNAERDNLCQFNHMMENIGFLYGIRPRRLRPSLYLDQAECQLALQRLSSLPRPILCLHPHGTSSPERGHPWFEHHWQVLLQELGDRATPIEVGLLFKEVKSLPTHKWTTTIREMFALVWASDLFVGFDSSVAHVATAFERPAAVLWDPYRKLAIEERWQTGFSPASLSRWSYPQNRNLMLLGDRDDAVRQLLLEWIRATLNSMGR